MLGRFAGKIWAAAFAVAFLLPAYSYGQVEEIVERDRNAPVRMEVDNGNWLDVRVYAVRAGGIFDRIGTVRSFTKKEFELPSWVAASNNYLQLVVAPIGSRERYAAPPVMVQAGDYVEWKLGANLSNSIVSVRAGWNDH